MTYSQIVDKFLSMVAKIKSLNPAYKQPGDGSDGTCDCIGLIIGAIRRMGLKWIGIHGSNYAARKATVNLKKISSESDLSLGDIVYKAYEKGHARWALSKYPRYLPGGKYYNGDMKDYYHVGVVTSVNPLRITHMTSPSMKVDFKLGTWSYYGKAKPLVDKAGGTPVQPVSPTTPTAGTYAVVVSANGSPVKMRMYPSTACATWDKLPVGTKVKIAEPGESWAKIDYGKREGWYMMAKYLDIIGDGKGKY